MNFLIYFYHCFSELEENLTEESTYSGTKFDTTIDVIHRGVIIVLRMINTLQENERENVLIVLSKDSMRFTMI